MAHAGAVVLVHNIQYRCTGAVVKCVCVCVCVSWVGTGAVVVVWVHDGCTGAVVLVRAGCTGAMVWVCDGCTCTAIPGTADLAVVDFVRLARRGQERLPPRGKRLDV
eukprot:7027-Pyramimonas_sp.AAC.2